MQHQSVLQFPLLCSRGVCCECLSKTHLHIKKNIYKYWWFSVNSLYDYNHSWLVLVEHRILYEVLFLNCTPPETSAPFNLCMISILDWSATKLGRSGATPWESVLSGRQCWQWVTLVVIFRDKLMFFFNYINVATREFHKHIDWTAAYAEACEYFHRSLDGAVYIWRKKGPRDVRLTSNSGAERVTSRPAESMSAGGKKHKCHLSFPEQNLMFYFPSGFFFFSCIPMRREGLPWQRAALWQDCYGFDHVHICYAQRHDIIILTDQSVYIQHEPFFFNFQNRVWEIREVLRVSFCLGASINFM